MRREEDDWNKWGWTQPTHRSMFHPVWLLLLIGQQQGQVKSMKTETKTERCENNMKTNDFLQGANILSNPHAASCTRTHTVSPSLSSLAPIILPVCELCVCVCMYKTQKWSGPTAADLPLFRHTARLCPGCGFACQTAKRARTECTGSELRKRYLGGFLGVCYYSFLSVFGLDPCRCHGCRQVNNR